MGMSECKGCGLKFDTSTMKIFSGKKYCEKCAVSREKEVNAFKSLCEYIYETIYNKDCNMPFITTNLRRIKKEFNFSDAGMLTTLKYAIELENYDIYNLDKSWGVINLITRYYEEAKKFRDSKNSKNNEEDVINKILSKEPVYVVMKRSEILERQKRDDEERLRRYSVPPMTEKDVEEILENYYKNGVREDRL